MVSRNQRKPIQELNNKIRPYGERVLNLYRELVQKNGFDPDEHERLLNEIENNPFLYWFTKKRLAFKIHQSLKNSPAIIDLKSEIEREKEERKRIEEFERKFEPIEWSLFSVSVIFGTHMEGNIRGYEYRFFTPDFSYAERWLKKNDLWNRVTSISKEEEGVFITKEALETHPSSYDMFHMDAQSAMTQIMVISKGASGLFDESESGTLRPISNFKPFLMSKLDDPLSFFHSDNE